MLLPSAMPCDPRPSLKRFDQYVGCQRSVHIPSVGHRSQLATGISSTCRALHSLLGVHSQSVQLNKQARHDTIAAFHTNSRITKRKAPVPSPRGTKRRRDLLEQDKHIHGCGNKDWENIGDPRPSTPKRQRRIPTNIPFGLERSDFYALEQQTPLQSSSPKLGELSLDPERTPRPSKTEPEMPQLSQNLEEDTWGDEDDRMLVDMVLDKLKLSRKEWDECSRALGADQKSLGRRWKYLVNEGQVGLKFRRGYGRRSREDVRSIW